MALEELKHAAAYCGLDEEPALLALGGFLCVLKKSQNLARSDDDVKKKAYETILQGIENSQQVLKDYESTAFRASLPNPLTMLLPRPDFAPPGPPPCLDRRSGLVQGN